jgi:hypothetical protein
LERYRPEDSKDAEYDRYNELMRKYNADQMDWLDAERDRQGYGRHTVDKRPTPSTVVTQRSNEEHLKNIKDAQKPAAQVVNHFTSPVGNSGPHPRNDNRKDQTVGATTPPATRLKELLSANLTRSGTRLQFFEYRRRLARAEPQDEPLSVYAAAFASNCPAYYDFTRSWFWWVNFSH